MGNPNPESPEPKTPPITLEQRVEKMENMLLRVSILTMKITGIALDMKRDQRDLIRTLDAIAERIDKNPLISGGINIMN